MSHGPNSHILMTGGWRSNRGIFLPKTFQTSEFANLKKSLRFLVYRKKSHTSSKPRSRIVGLRGFNGAMRTISVSMYELEGGGGGDST